MSGQGLARGLDFGINRLMEVVDKVLLGKCTVTYILFDPLHNSYLECQCANDATVVTKDGPRCERHR